ncbi:AAA family ATPase [Thalassotalea fonticola]|uniref:AAA family ATPase n=1 Tax=Thalassotalea fonticola TaxID=3065649 RepID=A0ABZ0GT97_9GAMM|nr:AAA family ATPase [Colwelliaceae bacterium S1-1]
MSLFNFSKQKKAKTQQVEFLDTDLARQDSDSSSVMTVDNQPDKNVLAVDETTNLDANDNQINQHEKVHHFNHIAQQPVELSATGLSENLLLDLLIKHLQIASVLTLRELSKQMALAGGIVQQLIDVAKHKAWVENAQSKPDGQMRYTLSSIGELQADKALNKSGYLGPAPVPLVQYKKICTLQSSREKSVTLSKLTDCFREITFPAELLTKVGPALNSIKPILIYGNAGTGKSYFCRHLNLVFGDEVLIPYAIAVNEEIIQVFDPEIHRLSQQGQQENILKLANAYDPRWMLCHRPLIVSGGELTAKMLEVSFDPSSKTYLAPLQLKANNGILLLDDLGRQKITPKELFNRWIIPLEERRDFLTLQSGLHFELPFELILLFSTNLSPADLVDDAFLRRLGYKIEFQSLSKQHYQKIWFNECLENGLLCELSVFEYLVEHLHKLHSRKFLPCYPRDFIAIIKDQMIFKELTPEINKELLDFAWQSYFIE